ncbi:MAG: polyprenyl synthetase family protein [Actinomycetota bacterium]
MDAASPIAAGDARARAVRESVERALFAFLSDRRRVLPDASELIEELERVTRSGGKRLRPAFCVWGYRAGGGTDDDAIARAAASLELLHTFAIIHDDVMDRSPLRRGSPATYRRLADRSIKGSADRFGVSAAILVGDLAMALAGELWWTAGFERGSLTDAAAIYHAMRAEVIGGQYLDLLAAARGDATPEETRRISVLKSGRYTVERPLLIGAALAGAPPEVRSSLAAFGAPLGEAFQLRDDVIGAFGDPSVTGKDADGDLREGKQTLLVALARKVATPEQRATLDELLGSEHLDTAGAERLRAVLRDTGALDEVRMTITELLVRAREALDAGPIPAEAADALRALAEEAASTDV